MKSFLRIWSALMLIAGVAFLSACSGGSSQVLTIDSPAPDFKLKDLHGQTVSLGSFQGKTVLINFWSTTCPPCVDEMPNFQALFNDWASRKDVALLAIDVGEDPATVKDFIQTNNYTFPVLLDSQYDIAGKYNIKYTPTSLFISPEGKIKMSVIGAFKNKAAIEANLASLKQ